jgi:hypothetical protein
VTTLDDIAPEEVTVRSTPIGVIIAIVLAVGVVVGLLAVGATAAVVAVSHTEQGLCGGFGVPCTSLSLQRVRSLSGVALPDGSRVTEAYYNHTTASGSTFWAAVTLPAGRTAPLEQYQPYGLARLAPELTWAKRMHSLSYLGMADGQYVRNAVTGIDDAGRTEVFLFFATGP